MIRDTTAQRIASQWHSGQSSALYALASSGAILGERNDEYDYNLAEREIRHEMQRASDHLVLHKASHDLTRLLAYVKHHGPRPAVPDWYDRVIRKAQR